jgi:hypothetical protein
MPAVVHVSQALEFFWNFVFCFGEAALWPSFPFAKALFRMGSALSVPIFAGGASVRGGSQRRLTPRKRPLPEKRQFTANRLLTEADDENCLQPGSHVPLQGEYGINMQTNKKQNKKVGVLFCPGDPFVTAAEA